jgi:DNA-binding PadR family transcriptional regulator
MYERKVFLGFIRAHILHHAVKDGGIYGVEMMEELKRHGYEISPGTLYPILHEMENDGVLSRENQTVDGKIRKIYRATRKGEETLDKLKVFIRELSEEVLE